MLFDSIDSLKKEGFIGYIPIRNLMESCEPVDNERGIYLVLYPGGLPPEFMSKGTGGFHKGRDPNVDISILESKWVEKTIVIYIGQAGGIKGGRWSDNSLKSRIKSYMKFGAGKPVGHYGGRYIWQIEDSGSLHICWKPLPNKIRDPLEVEREMIESFRMIYGKRPFANLKD